MNIYYSPEFARCFRKLSKDLKLETLEKERIFRRNYRDPRLKTHKLSGKLAGRSAFWVNFKTRIVFSFIGVETVYFHSIGTHDLYK